MRKRFGLRSSIAGLTVIVTALVVGVGVAFAVTGAVSTTDDPGFSGPDAYVNQECLNGHGVNCNIYVDKRDVWLSGLPVSAALGAGTYFFEVNVPGGQPTPNDGGAKNLSDTVADPYSSGDVNGDNSPIPSGDDWTNREFSVADDGTITYSGSHQFDPADKGKIQLFPYDDTTNNGGVYILAVCKVPSDVGAGTPGVDARDCKYDAFKIRPADGTTPPAADLVVTKDATPSFTRDYDWSVLKSQTTSSTPIDSGASSVSVNYQVKATWSGPTDSGWQVTGTITVLNPNDTDFDHVAVTDAVDNGGSCSVTDGSDATIAAQSSVDFAYTCTYLSAPDPKSGTNTATATWDNTTYLTPNGSANFQVGFVFDDGSAGNPTITHNTTTVTDTFNGGAAQTLGVAGIDGSWTPDASNHLTSFAESYSLGMKTFTLTYTRSVTVIRDQCTKYDNTATVSSDATSGDNGSNASATVCGRAAGGLTMGFWQNKNGQGLITNQAYSGTACATLISYLTGFNPFSDLKIGSKTYAQTCAGIASYVYDVIKGATCSSSDKTCNTMLKAQMLATALDVYFSDPAHGDPIKGFNGNNTTSLGGLNVDLTNICKMIDGSGGGTCNGAYNTGAAFGAPPASTCQTVSQLLAYASAQANVGGTIWYGQLKATQVLAKDTFDSVNNEVAFTC